MSNLDDLRSSSEYNDDEVNEPVEVYEAETVDDDEVYVEEEPRRQNPLRLILLILLILALLCVLCFFLLPRLPFEIPGVGQVPFLDNTPAEPAPQATDEGVLPPDVDGTQEAVDGQGEPGVGAVDGTGEPLPPPGTTEALPGDGTTSEPLTDDPNALPLDGTGEPPADGTSEQPGDGTAQPPTDGTTEPPGDGTAQPPTDGTDEQPGDGTAQPPTDGTAEPPGDGTSQPPADGTTEPPTDGTAEPPGDGTTEPPASCDGNIPPVADANGPYDAMQGKGQAVVSFDGSASSDPDGSIDSYEWDFGDGTATETGESVTHGYKDTGTYEATLTVTDNCGATGQDTADVTVVGPTPPSQQEGDDAEETDEEASRQRSDVVAAAVRTAAETGTPGFCYRVQYGDTLIGISQGFGITIDDLTSTNGFSADYYVIEGQGVFIPTGQIKEGPNIYIAQPYDTLDSIAYHCGLTPSYLAEVNNLSLDAGLNPEQAVVIPPWGY